MLPSSLVRFTQDPIGFEPAQAHQIDRGLGMTSPGQHSALSCPQREDMTGTVQILGLSLIGYRGANGRQSILRGRPPVVTPWAASMVTVKAV